MSIPLKIFIGYDPSEIPAFWTLAHSIMKHSSRPVSINPLYLPALKGYFNRARHPLQSTEFSFTRFLVPYLCDYQCHALFLDCDMLVTDDVAKLFDHAENYPNFAVHVCKKLQKADQKTKMLGRPQTQYPRKNWSAVMLFNCAACTQLTPNYVETASGLDLHQFKWLPDGSIGELPQDWNYLVGEDRPPDKPYPSNIHWTCGGPWWYEYSQTEYSDKWRSANSSLAVKYSLY